MKHWIKYAIVAFICLICACKKDKDITIEKQNKKPYLTISKDDIILNKENLNSKSLKLTWTNAEFAKTGKADYLFCIESSKDKNTAKLSLTQKNTESIPYSKIKELLTNTLKLSSGDHTLKVYIIARQNENNIDLKSNVIDIKFIISPEENNTEESSDDNKKDTVDENNNTDNNKDSDENNNTDENNDGDKNKDDNVKERVEVKPTFNINTSDISISEENLNEEINFTWTNADFGLEAENRYYLNFICNELNSSASVTLSGKNEQSFSLAEIKKIAIEQLHINYDKIYTIDVNISSEPIIENNTENLKLVSDNKQITIKLIAKKIAIKPTFSIDKNIISISEDNLNENITINWTDADFGLKAENTYKLNLSSEENKSTYSIELSGKNTQSFTYEYLKKVAIEQLHINNDKEYSITVNVSAEPKIENNTEELKLVSDNKLITIIVISKKVAVKPTLNINPTNISIGDYNLDNNLVVNWTNADFGKETTINYSLNLSNSINNTRTSIDLTGNNTQNITYEELKKISLEQLKLKYNIFYTIEISITATSADNTEKLSSTSSTFSLIISKDKIAPKLTISNTTINLSNKEKYNSKSLIASWTNADLLTDDTYSYKLILENSTANKKISFDINGNSKSFSFEELNNIKTELGLIDGNNDINAYIYVNAINEPSNSTKSNKINITITLEKQTEIKVADIKGYNLVGNMFEGGELWNINYIDYQLFLDNVDSKEFIFIANFKENAEFKIVPEEDYKEWDHVIGMIDGQLTWEGGETNIKKISEAGYYKLIFTVAEGDISNYKLSVEKLTTAPKTYTAISIEGSALDNPVSLEKEQGLSHNWFKKNVTLKEGNLKFNLDNTILNLSNSFNYGKASKEAAEITIPAELAGNYNVYFNDIEGYYIFKKLN